MRELRPQLPAILVSGYALMVLIVTITSRLDFKNRSRSIVWNRSSTVYSIAKAVLGLQQPCLNCNSLA